MSNLINIRKALDLAAEKLANTQFHGVRVTQASICILSMKTLSLWSICRT
jgi:hypothetical protein